MIESLVEWFEGLMKDIGVPDALITVSLLIAIFFVVIVLYEIIRRLILPIVLRYVKKTPERWDDYVFSQRVLVRISQFLPTVFAYFILDSIPREDDVLYAVFQKFAEIAIIISSLYLVNELCNAMLGMAKVLEKYKGKSLRGLHQVIQIILIFVGVVLVIAALANKSPFSLLAGLGASAAVLMLIFKDTILGFVSGIQLSANDMLKVGDWITVPKYGADGDVIEITLNTVKVKNFDNTISMVPPYALVNDSFQNWKGMLDSKGRRVRKVINIDLLKVKFCTEEMIQSWELTPQLSEFMKTQKNVDAWSTTNLTMLRLYLRYYIEKSELVNHEQLAMVRQLEMKSDGMPLEMYFFTNALEWEEHENAMSTISEHACAIIPFFELSVYERVAHVN